MPKKFRRLSATLAEKRWYGQRHDVTQCTFCSSSRGSGKVTLLIPCANGDTRLPFCSRRCLLFFVMNSLVAQEVHNPSADMRIMESVGGERE